MRISRIFLSLILGLLCIAFLTIAFLPTIISTQWGTRQLTHIVNSQIPGHVQIKNIAIRWGSGQLIEGFVLKDLDGNPAVEIEKLSTEASLWQLIRGSTHLGHTKLHDLNAHITTDEKGISNLQRALGIEAEETLTPISATTIVLSDVEANLNLFTPGEPLALALQGRTSQGPLTGSFAVEAVLPDVQAEEWSQLGQDAQRFLSIEGSKNATLQAKVDNFPVDLIDQLASLKDPELNGLFRTLIGDKINITLDKEATVEGLAFNLTLLAPLLQGDVKGKVVNQEITLQEPANIHLVLKPEAVRLLAKNQLKLLAPSRLKITLSELVLPLAFMDSDVPVSACQLSFNGQAELQPSTRVEVSPLGPLLISNLQLAFQSQKCQEVIQIQVKGEAHQPERNPFTIDFQANLRKPTYLHELLANLRDEFKGTLKINRFPLSWPGLNPQQQENLSLAGNFVDIQLTFLKEKSKDLNISATLQSDVVKLSQASFQIDDQLRATKPFTIEYTLQPTLLERFEPLKDFKLAQPVTLTMKFQEFTLPLDQVEKGNFLVNSSIAPLEITQQSTQHILKINDFLLQLKGIPLKNMASQLSMKITLPTASNLLGKEALFSGTSNLSINSGQLTLSQLEANLKSSQAHVHVAGQLLPTQELILTHPLEVTYQLTPDALRELTQFNEFPKLTNTPLITFRVDPLHLNLAKLQPNNLVLAGHITIDRIMLQDRLGALTTIDQIEVPWQVNGPQNQAFLYLKGTAFSSMQQKPSQLAVQLNIFDWFDQNRCCFDHMKFEVNSHLLGIPTALITPFIAHEDLSPILGSSLDLELKTFIDRDQKTPGYWDMNVNSSNLHAQARLKFDDAIAIYDADANDKIKAMEFKLTMTPEGYQYLQKILGKTPNKEISLKNPVQIKGEFHDLFLPLKDKKFSPQQGRINLKIETSDIALKEIAPHSFKVTADLASQNMDELLQFNATISSSLKDSHVNLKGSASHLFDSNGMPALANANLNGDLQIQRFPMATVNSLLMLDAANQKRLNALLGNELDAQLNIQLQQMNGQLAMHLKSPRSESTLKGKIKKGVLTLTQPFEWETTVTPELSQSLFSDSFPMLSQAVGAEKPIKLTLASEGFSLPLTPFDLKKVSISKGTLALGKIQFRNQGELRNLLSLLKPISGDYLTIWFTPLYFQLNRGTLQIQRVDLLVADTYPLAAWGAVELDPENVDVVLGISGQALQQAFSIHGLDSDYMLQIPVTGKKGSVGMDKTKAMARISALVAQMQGTKETKLLGSVLEIAAGGYKDGRVPAPTTDPIPWQKDTPKAAQTDSETKKPKKKSKNSDSLLKGLEGEASGLLKDLFK